MQQATDHRRFAVLFVDDEEPALRLFDKFFSKTLRVFTAPSVDAATEVLRRHGDEIGVLITDQRMPGKRGVELLDRAREGFPQIVRILTTGYSDIQEAIDAVNRGEIFRYITKPWNPEALREELTHALELFALRRERALFLDEKLSVRQRQTQSVRVRELVAMVGALPGMRHTLHGVRALLLQLLDLDPPANAAGDDWAELDHWALIHKETSSVLTLGRRIARAIGGSGHALDEEVHPAPLLAAALETVEGMPLESRLPEHPAPIGGSSRLIQQLFTRLFGEAARLRGDGPVQLAAEELAAGLRLSLELPRAPLPPTGGTLLTSPPGSDIADRPLHGDLLIAFLIAHHHGGSITVRAGTDGSGLDIVLELPQEPKAVQEPPLEEGWMEEVLMRFEGWD